MSTVNTPTSALADATHRDRLAAIGVLTASIAHEINNILTPVLGYAQLAQRDPEDAALVRLAVDQAARGAERASRIASQILRLAKPGDAEHSPAKAEVGVAVEAAMQLVQGGIDRLNIEIERDILPGLEAGIDPVCLEQVLINIFTNAVHAMGPGGSLAIKTVCSARNMVSIQVSDTGPGISDEVLSRGFEPFPLRCRTSNGLGLSICKRLIEAAGGCIAAESVPGKGTRVTLQLPLAA